MPILPTVRMAYAALFENIGAFVPAALLWTLASTAIGVSGQLLAPVEIPDADIETALISIAPQFIALLAIVAGTVCISVVWHRFIILGEPANRLLPTTPDVIAPYLMRLARASVPIFALILAIFTVASDIVETAASDIVVQMLPAFGFALMVRLLLVLPASAVGDKATTVWQSLRVTRGHTVPLVLGLLACDLPWSVTCAVIDYETYDAEEGSLEYIVAIAATTYLSFARAVTWGAFMSFTYLRLARPALNHAKVFE